MPNYYLRKSQILLLCSRVLRMKFLYSKFDNHYWYSMWFIYLVKLYSRVFWDYCWWVESLAIFDYYIKSYHQSIIEVLPLTVSNSIWLHVSRVEQSKRSGLTSLTHWDTVQPRTFKYSILHSAFMMADKVEVFTKPYQPVSTVCWNPRLVSLQSVVLLSKL